MEVFGWVLLFSQLIFIFVVGVYFFSNLIGRHDSKANVLADSKKELEAMKRLRSIKLTEPLSEAARPKSLGEIIGQESAILALKAALCTPNPQHVIIYGPPGVGKTAAARIILDEAVKSGLSPFKVNAPFIELDATILQFDERSIADPLIGSVHDPIYNGAGSYGQAGIPQPKPGAVTKAHGGILFIDEIGELSNIQLNRLLKVLEDRKIIMSSSYYSKYNKNIPKHIHDIFEKGLPADFRLIGATTKEPSDIVQALRSRCREIYFRPLNKPDIVKIAADALKKAGLKCEKSVLDTIAAYSQNGRDAVNMVESAAAFAMLEHKKCIEMLHIEEVIEQEAFNTAAANMIKCENKPRTGSVLLPVIFNQKGYIAEVEAFAVKSRNINFGKLVINGITQSEEICIGARKLSKKSAALESVENALAALKNVHGLNTDDYDININFSSQATIEGPSAGCAVFCALYSAMLNLPVELNTIITGEMSISGRIFPVGGIRQKIEAAKEYEADTIIIPKANENIPVTAADIQILSAANSEELIRAMFGGKPAITAV